MNHYIKNTRHWLDAYINHGLLEIGLCDRCEGKGEVKWGLTIFAKCNKCKGTGTRKVVI